MRTLTRNRNANERGAITIHVAIALIALLSFMSFVADYGIMWVSRRQAQNSADAGALAGAVSLMLDGGSTSTAKLSAGQYASQNAIWADANSYDGTTAGNVDVYVSGTGAGETNVPPCGTTKGCVRVDVFRNEPDQNGTMRGTALPMFFGRLFGVTQQGVRATATAQTANGNSVKCLLPFAAIDRWADNYDDKVDTTYFPNDGQSGTAGWTQNDEFQPDNGDVYIPPYNGNTNHTGWKVDVDYGRQMILKAGSLSDKIYSSGWALQVDLPDSTGSQDYNWNIKNCNQQPVGIATAANTCPAVDYPNGCISIKTGMAQGPTKQGITSDVDSVTNQDSGAHWDPSYTGNGLNGAIVDSSGALDMSSPRIRPMAVIDIDNYMAQGCSGTTCVGKIANIIGFFVEGMCKDVALDPGFACPDPTKDVVGRIVTLPGTFAAGVGTTEDSAAFIKVIKLVR